MTDNMDWLPGEAKIEQRVVRDFSGVPGIASLHPTLDFPEVENLAVESLLSLKTSESIQNVATAFIRILPEEMDLLKNGRKIRSYSRLRIEF